MITIEDLPPAYRGLLIEYARSSREVAEQNAATAYREWHDLRAKLEALIDYWQGYPDRQVCAADVQALLDGRYDPREA